MSEAFKKYQIRFLIQIVLISAILFGTHSYILHYFAKSVILFFPLWQVYAFQIIVTTILFSLINYRYNNGNKEIFKLFMIATLVKMALAIVFLLPLILSETFKNKQPDVFNFFIPYFIYLFFEVFALTQFLQKK